MTTDRDDWQTAEDLAAAMGRTVRWIKDKFADGTIPTIKVGNTRYFTPECRALLHERQLAAKQKRDEGWEIVTRKKAS